MNTGMKFVMSLASLLLYTQVSRAEEPAPPPYDCLGGYCLGQKTTAVTTPKPVKISMKTFSLTTMVCGGQVVQIVAAHVYGQSRAQYGNTHPSAVDHVLEKTNAEEYFKVVYVAHIEKGWEQQGENYDNKGRALSVPFLSKTVNGHRYIRYMDMSPNGENMCVLNDCMWAVVIISDHPEREEICKKERLQGI